MPLLYILTFFVGNINKNHYLCQINHIKAKQYGKDSRTIWANTLKQRLQKTKNLLMLRRYSRKQDMAYLGMYWMPANVD